MNQDRMSKGCKILAETKLGDLIDTMESRIKELEEGGGGSRTAEAITITANGVTNTPEGKYYDPITVNVQSETPKVKLYAWKYNDGTEDKWVYTPNLGIELEQGDFYYIPLYRLDGKYSSFSYVEIENEGGEQIYTVRPTGESETYVCARDVTKDIENYVLPAIGMYSCVTEFSESKIVPEGAKILYPAYSAENEMVAEYVVGDGVKTLGELYQAKGLTVSGAAQFICSHYDISIYNGYNG